MNAVLQALVPIAVAIFNQVGPAIFDFIKSIASHPALDDNGKAAVIAISGQLAIDEKRIEAEDELPVPHAGSPTIEGETVPDPKPTRPG